MNATIPIAISARHVHLTQATLDVLFGAGHALQVKSALSQPGQFAAMETIQLVGPHGTLEHVRVLGPLRDADQVELSRSDEIQLGIDAPLRVSGVGRDVVFADVVVRVSPAFRLELHLDTDEGNAAGVGRGATARLVWPKR